jgi:hypothetical protein
VRVRDVDVGAGISVELLPVLAVPVDEVLFGIFSAERASLVAQTCERAEMPAQRVTPAAEIHLCRRTGRGAPDSDQAAGPGQMRTEPHAWESRRSVHVHHRSGCAGSA